MRIKANKKGKAFIATTAAIAAAAAGFVIQRTETPEIYYDGNEFREAILLSETSTVDDDTQMLAATPAPDTSASDTDNIAQTTVQNTVTEENSNITDNTVNIAAEKNSDITYNTVNTDAEENSSLININTASAKELDQLEGIGEKLAQRIIEYRMLNGNFNTIEDIMKVSGIGIKKFESMKAQITV